MDAVTSPLKVRQRKARLWAEDANGAVVIDGNYRDHRPDQYLCNAPMGAWRINAVVQSDAAPYYPVIDPSGQEAARIELGGGGSRLRLPTGEVAEIKSSGGGLIKPFACEIVGLSWAEAPRFAPQRYFTLTLTEAALANPAREAIAVVAVWQSETKIATAIVNSNIGGD
jgi:hypothetical protein